MKQAVAENETPKAREQSNEQTGHTPGEWIVFVERGWPKIQPIGSAKSIAQVCGCFTQAEEQANARLIAAAPELLEACKLAVGYLSQDNCENVTESDYEKIITVVAKAEGK